MSVLQRKQDESVVVSLLILWIIDQYQLIDRILTMLNGYYPHYSEAFIHASALAKKRGKDESQRIRAILTNINDGVNPKWKFDNNYKTAIAPVMFISICGKKGFDDTFLTLF
jgi:hypothetical protein